MKKFLVLDFFLVKMLLSLKGDFALAVVYIMSPSAKFRESLFILKSNI